MDQQKIGNFLKELRKEKNFTQQQLSEKFNVSNRTVSRWENGYNLPDLDILIELSDFYGVDLREMFDGERKSGKVNCETKETLVKAADYVSEETIRYTARVRRLLLAGWILWFISSLIRHTGLDDISAMRPFSDFAEGAATGMILCGILFTSRYGHKIKSFKNRLLIKD